MIPEKPLISVFIITYNHEPYIAEAIEGVVMQKVDHPIEIIIGEDYSTDGTYAICQRYAQKYPELITLLPSARNLGMMGNFLRTLKSCKGRYIAFCEGDDYWVDERKLQKQIDFLEANPSVVFTFHASKIVDVRTGIFGDYYKHKDFKTGILDKGILFEKGGGSFVSPSILFKSEILSYPDWVTNAATGDFPLLLLGMIAGDIGYMDDPMCVVRLKTGVSWSESFTSYEKYYAYFLKEDAYLKEFNKYSGFRFNKWLRGHMMLRVYRLILHYYRFHPSVLKRLGFLLKYALRLNLAYFVKSVFRLVVPVKSWQEN
jgi:glycosyltransferase involved in cell wall biosynthesis